MWVLVIIMYVGNGEDMEMLNISRYGHIDKCRGKLNEISWTILLMSLSTTYCDNRISTKKG